MFLKKHLGEEKIKLIRKKEVRFQRCIVAMIIIIGQEKIIVLHCNERVFLPAEGDDSLQQNAEAEGADE